MLGTLREAASPAPGAGDHDGLGRRASVARLRALFLRRLKACGDVRRAAALAGVGRSTLYRWREKDARFSARWMCHVDRRRHESEGRLLRLVREGEKRAVRHKGKQVGWRVCFTVRPASALLASLDRGERARLAERVREVKRANVSHSGGRFSVKRRVISKAWPEAAPRKKTRGEAPPSGRATADGKGTASSASVLARGPSSLRPVTPGQAVLESHFRRPAGPEYRFPAMSWPEFGFDRTGRHQDDGRAPGVPFVCNGAARGRPCD